MVKAAIILTKWNRTEEAQRVLDIIEWTPVQLDLRTKGNARKKSANNFSNELFDIGVEVEEFG